MNTHRTRCKTLQLNNIHYYAQFDADFGVSKITGMDA